MKKNISFLCFLLAVFVTSSVAQHISSLNLTTVKGIGVAGYTTKEGVSIVHTDTLPFFTFELNDDVVSSLSTEAKWEGDSIRWSTSNGITGSVKIEKNFSRGWKAIVTFINTTSLKQKISGVVPLGESSRSVYIKAAGPSTYIHRLSRSKLFRPGVGAIGVVLPDNAWEMGFNDVKVTPAKSLTAIARRIASTQADVRRFFTTLEPNGFVQYVFYVDDHEGDWQSGLRMMFQERWIYDLERFDNTLFERKDLEWIRHSYLLMLQFAWDQQYYDAIQGTSHFDTFLKKYNPLIGWWDVYMLWPTWPRLGLDQRNQWDMYRDLPGGIRELRRQAEFAHKNNVKYFISYNPWDQSTREEGHTKGMQEMLRAIDGDGVVLDTWGESNKEFQDAADRVKPGIILYSEGMAVPKDMPTIVAGRVHDAIYLPPPLNLNKLIKPEFAIFRVAQLAEGRIHRETAVAFFNGYGTELNIMRPGRPDWIEEELTYLGRTTKILRENSSAFLSRDWTPLLPTRTDSIWVNKFPSEKKTMYTVLSFKPEGWNGALFEVPEVQGHHYVSLWNHEELELVNIDGKTYAPVTVDGFSRSWLGTRREGNVDCIALFPTLLNVSVIQDSIRFAAN
ncbi:MAG: sulfatase-modifying factor protein, partial [Bacteroidota bacterium]